MLLQYHQTFAQYSIRRSLLLCYNVIMYMYGSREFKNWWIIIGNLEETQSSHLSILLLIALALAHPILKIWILYMLNYIAACHGLYIYTALLCVVGSLYAWLYEYAYLACKIHCTNFVNIQQEHNPGCLSSSQYWICPSWLDMRDWPSSIAHTSQSLPGRGQNQVLLFLKLSLQWYLHLFIWSEWDRKSG